MATLRRSCPRIRNPAQPDATTGERPTQKALPAAAAHRLHSQHVEASSPQISPETSPPSAAILAPSEKLSPSSHGSTSASARILLCSMRRSRSRVNPE